MSEQNGKHSVAVVTACMRRDGLADFVLTEVKVTAEQAENGLHFYLVEADLLEAGFEEPFTHFDEGEAPAFLFPAVKQYLHSQPTDTSQPSSCERHSDRCPSHHQSPL